MHRLLKMAMIILLVIPLGLSAQDGKRVKTKKQRKKAIKQQEVHKDALVTDYNKHSEHHKQIQDKATRKRMRKNERTTKRRHKGTEIPFYKRWFRKNHFR